MTYQLITAVLFPFAGVPQNTDWPQWRGPSRTSIVSGDPWPSNLNGLNPTWRVKLGPGYSGPIVVGDRVFVTETEYEKDEVVRALDRHSGRELWRQSWPGAMKVPFFARSNGDWIRSTPACDGERLFVAGMRDKLVCLSVDTGEILWEKDFVREFNVSLPAFGLVCSPMVDDDGLYIHAGGAFCKLDKKSGEIIWRSLEDGNGMFGGAFSSPVAARFGEKRQIIVQTRTHLAGLDPSNGETLWKQEVPNFRGMNILTPTVFRDGIFTSGYQRNSWLFRIGTDMDQSNVAEAWENKLKGYMSSPVLIDNHFYLHLQNQRFACIEAGSGKIEWITSRRFGKYWSMVAQPPNILALDETGELFLIEANPKEFTLLDEKKVSEEPTWGHLAIKGRELFVRELHAITAWRWDDGKSSTSPGSGDDTPSESNASQ